MVVIASGTKDQNMNKCKKNHNYGLQNPEYEQMSKDQVASKTRIWTSQPQVVSKIVSEYDKEIPQSQTAGNPVAPRGRVAQPSRDTRKTN